MWFGSTQGDTSKFQAHSQNFCFFVVSVAAKEYRLTCIMSLCSSLSFIDNLSSDLSLRKAYEGHDELSHEAEMLSKDIAFVLAPVPNVSSEYLLSYLSPLRK